MNTRVLTREIAEEEDKILNFINVRMLSFKARSDLNMKSIEVRIVFIKAELKSEVQKVTITMDLPNSPVAP